MRRRHSINVWPAFADLMTVLAVVGLFTTISVSHLISPRKQQDQEAARNREMFRAIQDAQNFIDEISDKLKKSGLAFSSDQSLQFGDDLVTFDLNGLEPKWKADGRNRLKRFCEAISNQQIKARGSLAIKDLFVVHVEGHTDSTDCPDDPSCNWRISSGRAAAFVSLMLQTEYCPGGAAWNLRPIGYADTKPAGEHEQPTRRIAVKLVPNYEQLVNARWKG